MSHPLLRTALAGLRAHVVRLLMTAAAIMIGVSFLAGSLVYGDTARAAFYDDLARAARNVDVSVRSFGVMDREVLDRVRAVDGVAAADGRVVADMGMVGADGRLLLRDNHVGYVLSVPAEPSLSRFDVAAGRLPGQPGEIAVERATVEGQGFQLGQSVTVVDRAGDKRPLTLVGVLDLGANRTFGGQSVAALTDADLQSITGVDRYIEIVVAAADGVGDDELRSRVESALESGGGRYRVLDGAEVADDLAEQAAKYVNGFLAVLIGFGLVALTVSGFVIYNTFAVLAAQRTRELALLRCVGASRPQVFATVLIEASVLGVIASLGGVLASLVVGSGLLYSRELIGSELPDHPLVLGAPTVLVAVGFGTLLTLLGALVPAVGASRVPPLAALHEAGAIEYRANSGRRRRLRIQVAAVLIGLGLVAILTGLPLDFAGLPLVLGGAMLGFLGCVVAAPLLVGHLIRGVGWLPAQVFGLPVRLAILNARRNPRRVAATTTALMIGVTLMALFSVLLATARDQAGRELTENFPVEFVLEPQRVEGPGTPRDGPVDTVPQAVVTALGERPELSIVAPVRIAPVSHPVGRAGGRDAWAVPPDQLRGPIAPEVMEGDLTGLGVGTAAVRQDFAADAGVGVGDQVALGPLGRVRIIALYDDAPVAEDILVSWDQFRSVYGAGDPNRVLIDVAGGRSLAAARQAIDAVLLDYPLVQVSSEADTAESLAASLNELLAIFAALLATSVLIALFGISNTVSLSVFERTRESATLRALGLTRRQLRATLLCEAALMALVGALAGIALGTSVGWAAALGLISTYGHGLPIVPVGQLALLVLAAAVAAMVAAVVPARRAARASLAAALADTG